MWSSNWLVRCESIIYYYFDSFDELNVIRFILSFEFGKGRNRQWMNEESESKKKNLEQMKNRTRECQSCMHWPLRQVQYSTVEKVHKQWLNSSQKCKIANHGQNNALMIKNQEPTRTACNCYSTSLVIACLNQESNPFFFPLTFFHKT